MASRTAISTGSVTLAQAIAIGRPWLAPKTDASTPSSCLHGRKSQLKHPERVGNACCIQVEHTPGSMAGRYSLTTRGIASSPKPQVIDRYADNDSGATMRTMQGQVIQPSPNSLQSPHLRTPIQHSFPPRNDTSHQAPTHLRDSATTTSTTLQDHP